MRRIVGAVVVALVLAGCGGTDWKSAVSGNSVTANAAKSAKSAKAAKAAQLAVATAKTERAYVDALVATSYANDPSANAVGVRCASTAIVHGFGVAAFKRAGLTTAELRTPNSSLKSLGTPTPTQVATLGAAFQKCGLGTPVARAMASGLGTSDAASITCLANRLDTTPAARGYLVVSVLGRPIDLLAAHTAVGMLAACVDLPTMFVQDMGIAVDATTRACLLDSLKSSKAKLEDYIATLVAKGPKADEVIELRDSLSVDVNRCRPSARTGFTATASG
jgi:hypothetical protein